MTRVEPPRHTAVALAGVQVLDGLFNLLPSRWIEADLDHLELPRRLRFLFGGLKLASTGGLLVGLKYPRLGRLTCRALVVYFVIALGAHWRVRDRPWRYVPAALMLAWSSMAGQAFVAS